MQILNVKAAAPSAILIALGASIKAHITQNGTIKQFLEDSGIGRATLYRLFEGNVVGSDVLITVLHSLGRYDLLADLVAVPRVNPMQALNASRAGTLLVTTTKPKAGKSTSKGIKVTRPTSLRLEGLGKPSVIKTWKKSP